MNKRLENYLLDVVSGERQNIPAKLVLIILSFLELVYIIGFNIRKLLYKTGIFSSNELKTRVISVGNLTVGGTGKTPVVERLARMLKERSRRVVVISRGYGSEKNDKPLVVSDGNKIQVTVNEAGDEVYMLARNLQDIPVVICKDRYQAGKFAEEKFNPDVIILDDGFQHWGLKRDLDIVVINALQPFGNNHLLPRGFLREPISALKRADMVVISRCDQVDKKRIDQLKTKIRSYNKGAGIYTSSYHPLYIQSLTSQEENIFQVDRLRGKKVLAISGIGNPESFVNGLEKLEADVTDSIFYPDHYKYEEQDLMDIAVQAQLSNVDWVITTEKDAVKFSREMVDRFRQLEVGIFTLGIELEFDEDNRFINNLF